MSSIDELARANIGVHTELRGGQEVTAGIGTDVLRWLEAHLQPGNRTIETGCGLTTIVFARCGTEHTCISPFPDEHRRVTDWCAANNIDTGRVGFIASRSDLALPGIEGPFALALIDGSHAFPHAFIDFWYMALALQVGGLVVVDDTQIWTGAVLKDFLATQHEWELVKEWDKTAAFRKIAELDEAGAWTRQPYVLSRSVDPDSQGLHGYIELVRHRKYGWAFRRARGLIRRKLDAR